MSEVAHELDVDGAQAGEGAGQPWNVGSLLKAKDMRLNLALVCALQAGQQLSGINAVRSLPSTPLVEKALFIYLNRLMTLQLLVKTKIFLPLDSKPQCHGFKTEFVHDFQGFLT